MLATGCELEGERCLSEALVRCDGCWQASNRLPCHLINVEDILWALDVKQTLVIDDWDEHRDINFFDVGATTPP